MFDLGLKWSVVAEKFQKIHKDEKFNFSVVTKKPPIVNQFKAVL